MSRKKALSIATWNINSVRLRIDSVVRLLTEQGPDILCLQETKCPQGQFPTAPLKAMGYHYIAEFGQKGYHGVAIVSRLPFETTRSISFCGKDDCRHISALFRKPHAFVLNNFYVPAGGDEPDPTINEKFDHKLKFLAELEAWSKGEARGPGLDTVIVGDLNVAPLEHDVWSSKALNKVVSHTPVEREALTRLLKSGGWTDVMRKHVPEAEKLYTWWSYRAKDWALTNRGRRLDHVWATEGLARRSQGISVITETRGWAQPSDHVPVIARFDV